MKLNIEMKLNNFFNRFLRPNLLKLAIGFLFAILFSPVAIATDVAILAYEKGYYTSLAKHTERWLASEQIATTFATRDTMSATLATSRLAILIGFDSPTQNEIKMLENFRSRGGRFIVFYSSSPALAKLMGVKILGFAKAKYPGQWSQMNFTTSFPDGIPREIKQTSSVLQRAEPLPNKGRVMATWTDRKGKSTGDAAWISSSAGFWMTHVLLADGDEKLKSRLLATLVGCLVPGSWDLAKANAKDTAELSALRDFAKKQVPRRGEIHAVWDHSGCGLYPGDWPRTMRILQNARVTDLFVNVAGAGFAHYPSNILPRSKTFADEGDQLSACLAAAKGTGIRVHAWILCFTATRSSPETLATFSKRGWRLKTSDGNLSEYLNPSIPGVRDYILASIDEIQRRYRVDGIHLDFVRWYEKSSRPKDAAEIISSFVATARQHVKRPAWLTTAVLGKYPMCIASVGQDWNSWLRTGIVDYVVPMDYTENLAKYESFLQQHASSKSFAQRTIVGIGVTANESRLSAKQVIEQIKLARKYNLPGVALFDLDRTLETEILPALMLGLW